MTWSPPHRGSRTIPRVDLARLKKQELDRLNRYGWVDRKAGIAHIPIDRAMDILAETGLPEPGRTAEAEPPRRHPAATEEGRTAGRQATNRGEIRGHENHRPGCHPAIVIAVLGVLDLARGGSARAESTIGDDGQRGAVRPEARRAGSARTSASATRRAATSAWATIFGRRPVILTLGLLRCPMLCNQVLNGLPAA